jgi:hypothetical protein
VTGNMPRRAIPFARSLSSRWARKAQFAFKSVYRQSNETDDGSTSRSIASTRQPRQAGHRSLISRAIVAMSPRGPGSRVRQAADDFSSERSKQSRANIVRPVSTYPAIAQILSGKPSQRAEIWKIAQ